MSLPESQRTGAVREVRLQDGARKGNTSLSRVFSFLDQWNKKEEEETDPLCFYSSVCCCVSAALGIGACTVLVPVRQEGSLPEL